MVAEQLCEMRLTFRRVALLCHVLKLELSSPLERGHIVQDRMDDLQRLWYVVIYYSTFCECSTVIFFFSGQRPSNTPKLRAP